MSLSASIRVLLAILAALLLAAIGAVPVLAASGPHWRIDSLANSSVAPGGTLGFFIKAVNDGEQPTDGNQITVGVVLPKGMTVASASLGNSKCFDAKDGTSSPVGASSIVCMTSEQVAVGAFETLSLKVTASASASGTLTAVISVAGGGAATETVVDPTLVSAAPPAFGIDAFDSQTLDEGGRADGRAGGHPFSTGVSLDFNTMTNEIPILGELWPVETVKDVYTELAPGVIGDPGSVWRCTLPELANSARPSGFVGLPLCPSASQVGTTLVRIKGLQGGANTSRIGPLPVFNLVPPPGVPAEFGFNVFGSVVVFTANVSSDGDYGITVKAQNIPEALAIVGTTVTFWGDPASPSHDADRACPGHGYPADGDPTATSEECFHMVENSNKEQEKVFYYTRPEQQAFLRNPTSCTAPGEGLTTTVRADSWQHPGAWVQSSSVSHEAPGYPLPAGPSIFPSGYSGPRERGPIVGIDECATVPFAPSFTATPTSSAADSPTGLDVNVSMPQQGLSEPGAISESDLKSAIVKFPVGVGANPAAANGLGTCTSAQIGLSTPVGTLPARFSETPAQCPDASKLGTLELESPLLIEYDSNNKPIVDGEGHPVLTILHGAVYLAAQQDNPFGSLHALYLVIEGEQTGIKLKLAGRVIENEQTGQVETVFDDNPQLPFEHLRLHLFGGERAALATPPFCGEYSTQASFEPWSGGPSQQLTDSFSIGTGPGGSSCPSGVFAPKLSAGMQDPTAGQASPFVLRLTREDGEGQLGGLSVTMPPGFSGYLAGIPRCSDAALAAVSTALGTGRAQEQTPSCPVASMLGTVTAGVGVGPDPLYIQSGRVFLAGPYKGAPFSLAVVVPAVAGPYDLGSIVVRNQLQINPQTAQVTAVSDPLPTIVHGIPVDLRDVRIDLNRPHFTLNPTSCAEKQITADVASTGGLVAHVQDRFQAAECGSLGFSPKFSASTSGKTSKANGASLNVHVATHEGSTNGGAPGESNIARVDVQLPVVLPARLPTLQKACTSAQFDANPAGCPEGSFVGSAIARTPILADPLSGPAILVSHGGEAFPDLVVLLQGEGVQIDLTGHTQIKKGITFSHFETVPDEPVSSFDLTLPQGPHAVLTTDIPGRNLCTTTKTVLVTKRVTRRVHGHNRKVTVKAKKAVAVPLLMPTTITAQNGAVIHQNTKIIATGCPKAVRHERKKAHQKKKK
jgi:Domain of unknown function DUF11